MIQNKCLISYVRLFFVLGVPSFDKSPNFSADLLLCQTRIEKEEISSRGYVDDYFRSRLIIFGEIDYFDEEEESGERKEIAVKIRFFIIYTFFLYTKNIFL